jgi:restriction system protein
MAVWTVKGGQRGEREDRLLENNLIGGGWEALPSLMDIHSKEALTKIYESSYPDQAASARANYVGQLLSLTERMQDGELVVMPLKSTGTVAVGKITGPYAFRTDLGDDLKHVRSVKWMRTDVARDAFDQDLLYSFGAFLTFGQVRRERAEERILAALKIAVGPTTVLESKYDDQAVADDDAEPPNVLGLAREQIRQAITQTFAGHRLTTLVAEVLRAQGFTQAEESPPGADMGVDILAGMGPLGMDTPRLAVQVKTGQAGVDEFRQLQGSMGAFKAEQGLLVAWSGFKGTVRKEARTSHFSVRLWDADDLLDQVFLSYDKFSAKTRAELPLSRIWSLSVVKDA